MKKMYIEDAVNYCLNHKAVIHTPTKDIYNSLMSYLDESSLRWNTGHKPSFHPEYYETYKKDTGIVFDEGNLLYESISYYAIIEYEIIELSSVSIDNTIYYNKDKAISKIESIFSSFPSAGDIYYYIGATGEVSWDTWDDHEIDKKRLAIGNIYKTKEEAESALDRVIKAYKG